MATLWKGSIVTNDGATIEDVTLSATSPASDYALRASFLRFLSVVEVSRIPLQLTLGSHYEVTSPRQATHRFFSQHLLASCKHASSTPWWQNATPNSPLGVLAAVEYPQSVFHLQGPRVTEVLFYASRFDQLDETPDRSIFSSSRLPTQDHEQSTWPSIAVHAVLLSSDLLAQAVEATPPVTPYADDAELEGTFLPSWLPDNAEVINEPRVRKRKTVNDTFNEASERRKKARPKGGEGIAAAAAATTDGSMPSLKHRRTVSISEHQAMQPQPRSLSRSPSVGSSRPNTAGAPPEAAKRSSLSRVQSISGPLAGATTEEKNRSIISRVVMAGMRLRGLAQVKATKLRTNSAALSPAMNRVAQRQGDEKQGDEEYKIIYHQVYKPHTEALRDTVDRLLDIFCSDPLSAGLAGIADKLTPGGRKAFGATERLNCTGTVP